MMQWLVHPNLGIGPLKLGMTRPEVATILDPLGPIETSHVAYDGSLNEFRDIKLPICNYVESRLAQIDVTPKVQDVVFDGINIFKSDPKQVLKKFEISNGFAETDLGIILYRDLCVYLQGFYDPGAKKIIPMHDQDDRRIAVFAGGRLDTLLSGFTSIDIDFL